MLSQETRKKIQYLIAYDMIEDALKLLLEVLEDEESRDALAIHGGTLTRVKKAYQTSQIKWSEMSTERARISYLVLSIVSDSFSGGDFEKLVEKKMAEYGEVESSISIRGAFIYSMVVLGIFTVVTLVDKLLYLNLFPEFVFFTTSIFFVTILLISAIRYLLFRSIRRDIIGSIPRRWEDVSNIPPLVKEPELLDKDIRNEPPLSINDYSLDSVALLLENAQ